MFSITGLVTTAGCIFLLCHAASISSGKDLAPKSSGTINIRSKMIEANTSGTLTAEEKSILVLILREHIAQTRKIKPDGFEIVKPQTTLKATGNYLQKQFARSGQDVKDLVDHFIKVNKNSARIDLPTSSSYVVDSDGKFQKYLAEKDGWKKLREANPNALGTVEFSRPAIDHKRNLVMIYAGMGGSPRAGIGQVWLYEYRNGVLKKIARAMLWIV